MLPHRKSGTKLQQQKQICPLLTLEWSLPIPMHPWCECSHLMTAFLFSKRLLYGRHWDYEVKASLGHQSQQSRSQPQSGFSSHAVNCSLASLRGHVQRVHRGGRGAWLRLSFARITWSRTFSVFMDSLRLLFQWKKKIGAASVFSVFTHLSACPTSNTWYTIIRHSTFTFVVDVDSKKKE